MSNQSIFRVILLFIIIIFLLQIPVHLPQNVGSRDFRPYWSSSFLLINGEDFSNSALLYSVEQDLTDWTENYVMFAWFAPTGNLILLPYTFIPFSQATYYWLLTNIFILFFSAFLIWRSKKDIWIPLIAIFTFAPTLVSLQVGQVNTLVFLGLALFLFFSRSKQDWVIGGSLILTTIKAHLVILTLPLLFLDIVRNKKWKALTGFTVILFLCVSFLFMLYPSWYISFLNLFTMGMTDFRNTPTLSGILTLFFKSNYGKWLWIGVLSISLISYWKYSQTLDQRTLIDVSLLIGILISPVGWSYDQIILLFPILSILEWIASGLFVKRDANILVIILIVINSIIFYQRVLKVSEVWYFWVPVVLTAIYLFAKKKIQAPSLPSSPN